MAKSKVRLNDIATVIAASRAGEVEMEIAAGAKRAPAATVSRFLTDDKSDMTVAWPTQRIKVREDAIEIATTADMVAMSQYDWICDILKNGQHQKYNTIVADPHYAGPRIVAEGDSWFLHPLISDIINYLLKGSKRASEDLFELRRSGRDH